MKRLTILVLAILLICTAVNIHALVAEPVETTATPMIASVGAYTIALKADGTVWVWGKSSEPGSRESPEMKYRVPAKVQGLSDVIAVATGYSQLAALKSDGTVWTWERNRAEVFGNGTTEYRDVPKQVAGLTGVTAIAAGWEHTVALKSDGTVWAWGMNDYGQLGNRSREYSDTPVQVENLYGITEIAVGAHHTVALKSDGTVWAWGYDYIGQLAQLGGDSISQYITFPVQVAGLSDITSVSWGGGQFALKSDGTFWAWGLNGCGQLGDGTTEARFTPVQVAGLTDFSSIQMGGYHVVALKPDGTVWTWGSNHCGELGDGVTAEYRSTPVQVPGSSGVSAVMAGSWNSFAVMQDGTVWAWGLNNSGQLGVGGTSSPVLTPMQIRGENGVGWFNLLGEDYKDGGESTPTGWKKPFIDVSTESWYYRDVVYVSTKGLMNGTSETAFSPDIPMPRSALVTVLWRMTGSPSAENGVSSFADIPAGAYYADAVKWATAGGIVNGVGSGVFAPDAELTKQDVAVILMRYMDYAEIDIPATREYSFFNDENQISDYAKGAIQTMNKIGIIDGIGDNVIQPKRTVTRAEVSAMLHRFVEALE